MSGCEDFVSASILDLCASTFQLLFSVLFVFNSHSYIPLQLFTPIQPLHNFLITPFHYPKMATTHTKSAPGHQSLTLLVCTLPYILFAFTILSLHSLSVSSRGFEQGALFVNRGHWGAGQRVWEGNCWGVELGGGCEFIGPPFLCSCWRFSGPRLLLERAWGSIAPCLSNHSRNWLPLHRVWENSETFDPSLMVRRVKSTRCRERGPIPSNLKISKSDGFGLVIMAKNAILCPWRRCKGQT